MLLAIAYRSLEACLALGRACIRLASPPPPPLRDLDARTLRDIGMAPPAARPTDGDRPISH